MKDGSGNEYARAAVQANGLACRHQRGGGGLPHWLDIDIERFWVETMVACGQVANISGDAWRALAPQWLTWAIGGRTVP